MKSSFCRSLPPQRVSASNHRGECENSDGPSKQRGNGAACRFRQQNVQSSHWLHNMSNAVKKIYDNLKRRERLGQAVLVTIDDYLSSQVCDMYFWYAEVEPCSLTRCLDMQFMPETNTQESSIGGQSRLPPYPKLPKLWYLVGTR